jgi:hypothetical protein
MTHPIVHKAIMRSGQAGSSPEGTGKTHVHGQGLPDQARDPDLCPLVNKARKNDPPEPNDPNRNTPVEPAAFRTAVAFAISRWKRFGMVGDKEISIRKLCNGNAELSTAP